MDPLPPPIAESAPAISPAGLPIGGPMPMYRGDAQHTGRSPFLLPSETPQERWRFATTGSVTAAPALANDGTIVFGSHDGFVYALTAQGTQKWRYRTADRIWSTPVVGGDGTIYIGSDDDRLHALQLGDGTAKWATAAGKCKRSGGRSPEGARCDVEQVTLGPDGTLYIGGAGIYALRSDGTVLWHFDPGARIVPVPVPVPVPGQPPIADQVAPASAPSAPNKKIHCSSAPSLGRDGVVYAICQEILYALGPDGVKRWEFSAQGEFEAAPAISPDGLLYLGSDDRRLYAIDPLGQVRFAFLAGAPIRTAAAVQRDGGVVFGCDDNAVYSVRSDGNLLWRYTTADAVHSSPLVDGAGSVVFGSRDDRLYAVAADGRLKWSVVFDADVDGTPTLGPDGTVYVGADDQALHALR
jgi:outer membrane protein assembly factor BamB